MLLCFNSRVDNTDKNGKMIKGLSSIKDQLKSQLIEQAINFAEQGKYVDAARSFDQSELQPSSQRSNMAKLAFSYYRSALAHQANLNLEAAVGDLVKALQFSSLPRELRALIQQRLSILEKAPDAEVVKFDQAVAGQFDRRSSEVQLRAEFIARFKLNQANRKRNVKAIDEISAVGVYRWAGDESRNEQWSRLIRQFKSGDSMMPAFFGRVLAEHVMATPKCNKWIEEVDYIVPVPSAVGRTAERGVDILGKAGNHLSSRLRIPIRIDFLKRRNGSERSRFASKASLASQYSFNEKKAAELQGRVVLLLDDVMNRGNTAGVCASHLRNLGCCKIVLLVLALSESSLQSSRHAGNA